MNIFATNQCFIFMLACTFTYLHSLMLDLPPIVPNGRSPMHITYLDMVRKSVAVTPPPFFFWTSLRLQPTYRF